ncbi:MAG: S9 family peptidase [Acidobacteria bacterium]|nr:S9 family peptidase [Acidobacteriota bacterium]MBV9475677.1 S9 family peptidase [Acidobacteriota bacterium]
MRRRVLLSLLFVAAVLPLRAELPPLIPRKALFAPPVKAWPQLSPDGKRLAYVAPDEHGVGNIWVQPAEGGEAKVVTHESRPIFDYQWAGDNTHLLFDGDDGDENAHIFSADLESGIVRDLTPFRGIRAQHYFVDPRHPNDLLVELNLRDRRVFDVHRVDLRTGAITLEATNPGDVNSWAIDTNFVVRGATAFDANGRTIVRVRDSASAPWRDLVVMPFERSTFMGQIANGSVIGGFAPDGKSLYVASALHSDTARIERIDAKTGATLEVMAEHPKADAGDTTPNVSVDPRTGALQGVRFVYMVPEWRFLDTRFKNDITSIEQKTGRWANIISRSADDGRWIVAAETANAPNVYYTYHRAAKRLTMLFDEGEALKGYTLPVVKPVLIRARDGRELVSYLTTPGGTSSGPYPFIVLVHGGPWIRDFPLDLESAFLANRGYAVLRVNFRGSTGFGIESYNAGNGQLGRGMVDDVLDGTRWAVAQGIADPKRLVAYGGSMGANAILTAMAREPQFFACGVGIVPVTDIRTAFEAFPPYWVAARSRWLRRIGDFVHDDALNRAISPLYHVSEIERPLFVAAGGHDVRARAEHVERFVQALRGAKHEVTYVLYPDEGHGFARPENQMDMYGRVEEFLARYAGGRAEPWTKVEGSTADVR